MKQNSDFILSRVADTSILVPVGKMAANFDAIISLKGIGAYIWNLLEHEQTEEKLISAVLKEYDVSEDKAKEDIESFLDMLRENGCIEE